MKTPIACIIIASLSAVSTLHAHCGSCSMDETEGDHGHQHAACYEKTTESYYDIQESLASDDLAAAKSAAAKLDKGIANAECSTDGDDCCAEVSASASSIAKASDLAAARQAFEGFSKAMIAQVESHGSEGVAYQMYCPMAFNNKGAAWLQNTPDLRNPYFGSSMLACGMTKATYGEDGKTKSDKGDNH